MARLTFTCDAGRTLAAVLVQDSDDYHLTVSGTTFGAYSSGSWLAYQVSGTETSPGDYYFTMPAGTPAFVGHALIIDVAGGTSVSLTDTIGRISGISWDGSAFVAADKTGYTLASDGIDAIDDTEAAGAPTNFRERLMWLVARLFNRCDMDAGTITVMRRGTSTPMTTQTSSDTDTSEVQGGAS